MSTYIGQLGRLVELPNIGSTQIKAEERYSFVTTLEGRVKAQARSVGRRSWNLGAKHYRPEEQGALMGFASGEWGYGPFVFVSYDATVTNMLSPAAASSDPSQLYGSTNTAAGPMRTGDTWAGRSFANPDPSVPLWFSREQTPVLPGRKVTASAWVRGAGADVRVQFYDAAGTDIETIASTVIATAGGSVRSHVTATPPSAAVSCRVLAGNATQGAHPAITWTDQVFPWSDGQGCPKAVLHGVSRDLVKAINNPHSGRWSDVSFTVTEVG